MKLVFDNSIHLGQFSINNERLRVGAKNSQILISAKPSTKVVGVESFNEIGYSDNIIWNLEREPQNIFYKFMDVYHSVKNIERTPLTASDAKKALEIANTYQIHLSNALSIAIAVDRKAAEIHSFYPDFQKPQIVELLKTADIATPTMRELEEKQFEEQNLEQCYQDALNTFKKHRIELTALFHS